MTIMMFLLLLLSDDDVTHESEIDTSSKCMKLLAIVKQTYFQPVPEGAEQQVY